MPFQGMSERARRRQKAVEDGEQRKRREIAISGQELRIEKEEMATARLDMRIKVDKQRLTEQKERLSELRRVEAEKGGDALFELPR